MGRKRVRHPLKTCVRCERQYERPQDYSDKQWASRKFCSPTCFLATPLVRFMEKVERDPVSGCWNWTGALVGQYGCLRTRGKPWVAHRYGYEALRGPVPPGLHLDHLCRNRACVNPAHLEPVTRRENVRRGLAAKLSSRKAAEIRSRYLRGGVTQRALGIEFGTDKGNVSRIVNGKAWVAF